MSLWNRIMLQPGYSSSVANYAICCSLYAFGIRSMDRNWSRYSRAIFSCGILDSRGICSLPSFQTATAWWQGPFRSVHVRLWWKICCYFKKKGLIYSVGQSKRLAPEIINWKVKYQNCPRNTREDTKFFLWDSTSPLLVFFVGYHFWINEFNWV